MVIPGQDPILDLSAEGVTEAQVREWLRMATFDAHAWFSHYAKIRLKDGKIMPVPKVNVLQERVLAHYRWCQLRGLPCLIMVLKPRQKGASTIAEGVIYHHMRRYPSLNGMLMGDVDATSDKVFEMFRRYAELDTFPWGDGLPNIMKDENLADDIMLGNGSTFGKETAGSKNAGRGGTIQVGHWDETAFYQSSGGKDPMLAALNSFADELPTSLGFATSTANGASGWFYNTWNGKNAWHKIFAAWFEFEDSARPFAHSDERERFMHELTEDERKEQALYKVTPEQLHWRRHTIETKCEGDANRFRQEYPSNAEECFMLSSSPKFDPVSVRSLMDFAKANDKRERCNLLIQTSHRAAKVPEPTGDVIIQEEPVEGLRYLTSVDTCTGEDQQEGHSAAERDWHSVQTWRQGYTDMAGVWQRPALVALHHSQIDTDVLAEITAAMSLYYGRCLTVPEVNGMGGLHVVKQLLKYRIPVFRRRAQTTSTNQRLTEQERLGQYGWNTDKLTKKLIIDHMVPMVRKEEIDVRFSEVLEEFRTFVVNAKGGCEAMGGKHDDHVLAAAIALYNLGAATEYRLETMQQGVDLRRMVKDRNYLVPAGFRRMVM